MGCWETERIAAIKQSPKRLVTAVSRLSAAIFVLDGTKMQEFTAGLAVISQQC